MKHPRMNGAAAQQVENCREFCRIFYIVVFISFHFLFLSFFSGKTRSIAVSGKLSFRSFPLSIARQFFLVQFSELILGERGEQFYIYCQTIVGRYFSTRIIASAP